jgi:hypothetical protein
LFSSAACQCGISPADALAAAQEADRVAKFQRKTLADEVRKLRARTQELEAALAAAAKQRRRRMNRFIKGSAV